MMVNFRCPTIFFFNCNVQPAGLDVTTDRILEIACIITDGKLTKSIEVAFTFYTFKLISFARPCIQCCCTTLAFLLLCLVYLELLIEV